MRASEQEGTGSAAANYVAGDFERIGWGPVVNHAHDLGTDLFLQVRDERRFARNLVVGAQVKGGPSFFEEPHYAEDGKLKGWWFYESTAEHFDDWVRYGFPHLVVLYNFETKKSHWVHVTAEQCIRTGKGCKILVPLNQTVDAEHLDALLDVATAQRAAGAFEQKAFHASAASAAPGHRLRYALLTPRLIAPHGNAGYSRPLEPEEYVALLTRRRSYQIWGYKKEFPEELSSERMKEEKDWRWRFAHALEEWLETGAFGELIALSASKPDTAQRSALVAVLAAAYVQSGLYAQAQQLLDDWIDVNDATPVDFAWLLVHRATVRSELGDVAGARSDAAKATSVLRGEDDPTAALLAGVAASILFVTAGFGSGDLEQVINSNDTAPAWWRAQTLSWALGHLDDEAFDEWSSDGPLRFSASDEGWEQLDSARLNAALASDRDALRSIVARQGRYLLRRAHERTEIAQGLNELRRAGDKDALSRAMSVIWHKGPVLALREVAELAPPSSITRSTALATITLWGHAADALTEEYASELSSWCTRLLSDDSTKASFRQRFGSTFHVDSYALDALEKLLPVASSSTRVEVARLLLKIPVGSVLSQTWARVVLRLDIETLRAIGLDDIRAKVAENHDFLLKNALLSRLAVEGDASARAQLIERAETDVHALACVPGRPDFDENTARHFIELLRVQLLAVRKQASGGSYGIGGVDAARLMAHLNFLHPSVADWDSIFEYLTDDKVAAEDKAGVIGRFVIDFDRADHALRSHMRATLPSVLETSFRHFTDVTQYPEAAWRLNIMLVESEGDQESVVATFLSGCAAQRRVAAQLLGRGIAPMLAAAIHTLLVDDNRQVRASAASALGRIVGRGGVGQVVWLPAVARVASDSGGEIPSWFLNGISAGPFSGDARVLDAMEPLRSHPSFHVRQTAGAFFSSHLTQGAQCQSP